MPSIKTAGMFSSDLLTKPAIFQLHARKDLRSHLRKTLPATPSQFMREVLKARKRTIIAPPVAPSRAAITSSNKLFNPWNSTLRWENEDGWICLLTAALVTPFGF